MNADFETWAPQEADFDAVVTFASFHWLDPDTKYAKVARLLRPGGALAVTHYDYVTVPGGDTIWAEAEEDYEAVFPSADFAVPPPPEAVTDLRGVFREVDVHRYQWAVTFSTDRWIDSLGAFSPNIAAGPGGHRAAFVRIRAKLEARPERTVTQHLVATLNLGWT